MSLIEFLEARIAEDEAAARAAAAEPAGPKWGSYFREVLGRSPEAWVANTEASEYAAHAARHDPARVLAECVAKRAIIKQADEASSDRSGVINEYCVGDKERAEAYATDPGKLILEALAAIYSDHPDYQQEWAQ